MFKKPSFWLEKNLLVTVTASLVFVVAGLIGSSVALAAGPPAVNLGTAGNFAILSQAGITDIPTSAITGNVGTYPITGAAIGLTCPEVTGTIYSRNAAGPLPCRVTNATLLNTAVNNMGTAYTDAATRTPGVGPNLNVGAGTLAGQNFAPGTYTWGTPVTITGDITLTGTAADVWIFQISGTLNLANGIHVNLVGANPSNIFWQVADVTTLGTTSVFNGNILDKTLIALQTGAVLNGRALAQTQVTLDHSVITSPEVSTLPTPIFGSISGMKYNDTNGNGHKNSGEGGLSGWTINLMKAGSSSVLASTVTDGSGNYTFSNLGSANYKVSEVMQAGWKQTDHPGSVNIHSGTNSTHNDFGNRAQPIKVGPIHVTGAEDIGTCNNVWALDSFNKFYTISSASAAGAYNVKVEYRNGKFVSIAGISPGACEVSGGSGPGNGNTVGVGIKGTMEQLYNGTITGTLSGNSCTPAICVDTASILNTLFNPGWSWTILSDGGHWIWSNTYKARHHGTWFDTSVNWPFNDTGDITGS